MNPTLEAPSVIHGSAVFGQERTLRYEICRWWTQTPQRWAAWLMLNPSHAGEDRNDPTALRVTHFTRSWGYDGWIGVNLYPIISSTPDDAWAWSRWQKNGPDWCARDGMQSNREHIRAVAQLADLRVVAFGAAAWRRDPVWLEECLEAFRQPTWRLAGSDELYCLGVNKEGQPLHPMARGKWRVPDDRRPQLWEPAGLAKEGN